MNILKEIHEGFKPKCDLEVNDIVLPEDYDSSKPNMAILDDYKAIVTLFKRLINRTKIKDKFNMFYFDKTTAPLALVKTIKEYNITFDVVITDITFGLSCISKESKREEITGIHIVDYLNGLNKDLIYLFVTGHVLNEKATPDFFKQYKNISDDSLKDHVVYKNNAISTNLSIIENLLKGSKYEKYLI